MRAAALLAHPAAAAAACNGTLVDGKYCHLGPFIPCHDGTCELSGAQRGFLPCPAAGDCVQHAAALCGDNAACAAFGHHPQSKDLMLFQWTGTTTAPLPASDWDYYYDVHAVAPTPGAPTPAPPAPAPGPAPAPLPPAPGGAMWAADPRAGWAGRRAAAADGSVSFDWLGVTARVSVTGATWVSVNVTAEGIGGGRGTRMRAYASDQGFDLYPMAQVWVSALPQFRRSMLWSGPRSSRLITLSNIVAPQYRTGITRVLAFETDGTFVAAPPQTRRMEFVGDSITAATNVVRPPGAPSCGDGGFQSDWTQTYEGLLCQHFGASCSTIAVGGKCVMKECGGLQMPDYFNSLYMKDAPKQTYDFQGAGWKPDAFVIDLGTNDMRVIKTANSSNAALFANETVAFMRRVTQLYAKDDIEFFLTIGPMENTTQWATESAVSEALAAGLRAHAVDMRAACAAARQHGNGDHCDGCAGHPGIEGHFGMYTAAVPVIKDVMGWD